MIYASDRQEGALIPLGDIGPATSKKKAEVATRTEGDLGVHAAATSVVPAATAVRATAILDVSDSCACV